MARADRKRLLVARDSACADPRDRISAQSPPSESARLIAGGFDGLYHPSQPCGCFVSDLRPCGQVRTGCRRGQAADGPNGHGVYRPRIARVLHG